MSLLWAEGFDNLTYGSSRDDIPGWYASDGSSSDFRATTDRHGTSNSAVFMSSSSTSIGFMEFRCDAADEHSTFIVGQAILPNRDYNKNLWYFLAPGGSVRATLWNENGVLRVRSGSSQANTILVQSSVKVIDNATWYYIEIKYVVNGSTGSIEIKVNGLTVASASSIDTTGGLGGTTLGGMYFHLHTSGGSADELIDDIYVCNAAGSANNDYLGDVWIHKLRPDGAGSPTDWSASAGTKTGNVSSLIQNTSQYNYSGTDEQEDFFTMSALPAGATGDVLGVVTHTAMWCSALNTGAATLVKDSTTTAEEAEFALTTTVPTTDGPTSWFHFVYETKPSGGAWTTSEVNGVQRGVKVKSIT